ncbi:MAG: triple tyrosine motif-containing protein [Lutibacter sp.]
MKSVKYFFLNLSIFFVSVFIEAQELPPIENYLPKIYAAENQNWSISQSSEKYIYVANNSGLLEFNGADWKLYPSPNNTILRSVNVIGNRVYTGSYMEFGYWIKNEFGSLDYNSLSKKLKEPLLEEEFWNIIEFDNWILFQSLHRIYIYNTVDEKFSIINSKTNLPKVFKVGKSIFYQKMNDGIYKIENGKPVLVTNHPILQNNILVNIFSHQKKILFQTQDKGCYFLDEEKKLSNWDFPLNNEISSKSVYSSLQLADGSFVIGTISNGIYHLDIHGNLIDKINQENGLNNNTVLSMFEDSKHNVWLGLDNGISVINYNSPFSVYNDIHGKLGTVYTSAIFNNKLYLGTNQGLFYKNINSNEDFNYIKNTNGQVWCLKVIDNTLFCGHNVGTFIVNNNNVELIANKMGTWDIKPIKGKENLLIQGNYDGLNVLEKVNNKWQFRNKIEGFDISSRYFELTDNHLLFVNHEYKGVFKLKINDNFTKIEKYSTEISVPKGLKSSLVTYNNSLLYTCKNGIFKYNHQQQKFIKDSLLSSSFLDDDTYLSGNMIVDSKTNTLWGFTNKNMIYFSPGQLNNILKAVKISLPVSLRRDIAGYESMTHLNDHLYLFGTSRGYIILNLDKIKDKEFDVNINSISKSILNAESSAVSLKNNNQLKNKENNLFFTFSVPEYDKYSEVNYQYQLKGIYNEWSNWSINSEVSFTNLPFGSYTFNVKARIGNNVSSNIASYSFSVQRPWQISAPMLFLYLILFIAILFLTHLFYKRYYAKQKQNLINKKQQEFSLSQLENEKVIMALKNENLQNEIESKTKELSVSTMSIIRKNEILNTIKNELLLVSDENNIKPVLKIINKNIANNSDWELFQEAFNNADSNFLKKVKVAHPTLTPNDLRLCAYLRLNLSSKEIAPLLNISARSVEIKRYRLRKKMDLHHEKSLVEYILEL